MIQISLISFNNVSTRVGKARTHSLLSFLFQEFSLYDSIFHALSQIITFHDIIHGFSRMNGLSMHHFTNILIRNYLPHNFPVHIERINLVRLPLEEATSGVD